MLAVILATLFNAVTLGGLIAGIAVGFVRARHRLGDVLAYAPPAEVRPPRTAVRAVLIPV